MRNPQTRLRVERPAHQGRGEHMTIFARRGVIKTPPEPTLEERLCEAEAQVNAAKAEITRLHEREQVLKKRFGLVRDMFWRIVHLEVPDAAQRPAIERQVAALRDEHNDALQKF